LAQQVAESFGGAKRLVVHDEGCAFFIASGKHGTGTKEYTMRGQGFLARELRTGGEKKAITAAGAGGDGPGTIGTFAFRRVPRAG